MSATTADDDLALFRDLFEAIGAERVEPAAARIDAADELDAELDALFAEQQLLAISAPAALGGGDGSLALVTLLLHAIGRRSAAVALRLALGELAADAVACAGADPLGLAARVAYRRAAPGVVLVAPGVGRRRASRARHGAGTVVLTGEVGELVLHASGRARAAHVTVTGDDSDVARLDALQPRPAA